MHELKSSTLPPRESDSIVTLFHHLAFVQLKASLIKTALTKVASSLYSIESFSAATNSPQGDVLSLQKLLQQDQLVLDRFSAITSFKETSLHIASMRGYINFTRALLHHKPNLADKPDSLLRLPLHWASEKGHTKIVIELLRRCPDPDLDPDRAFFWRDQDERTPLHLAVMSGRNDVVRELIRASPESIREKVVDGGTILHLCVGFNKLEALKMLVDTSQGYELVNERDDHGNTILHLAAIFKQVEITKYLLSESINIDANASNVNGFTALDVVNHSPIDSKSLEIKILLLEAGVVKNNSENQGPATTTTPSFTRKTRCFFFPRNCNKWWKTYIKNAGDRLETARGNILVAATVTASMAFQAGINPPDYLHFEQKRDTTTPDSSAAAAPSPNSSDPNSTLELFLYPLTGLDYWFYNTLSLMLSLIIIMLMLSGIPFKNMFSSFGLVIGMQLVVISTTKAYWLAEQSNLIEEKDWSWDDTFLVVIESILTYLVPLMCLVIIFIHVCTFLVSMVFKIFKYVKRKLGVTSRSGLGGIKVEG